MSSSKSTVCKIPCPNGQAVTTIVVTTECCNNNNSTICKKSRKRKSSKKKKKRSTKPFITPRGPPPTSRQVDDFTSRPPQDTSGRPAAKDVGEEARKLAGVTTSIHRLPTPESDKVVDVDDVDDVDDEKEKEDTAERVLPSLTRDVIGTPSSAATFRISRPTLKDPSEYKPSETIKDPSSTSTSTRQSDRKVPKKSDDDIKPSKRKQQDIIEPRNVIAELSTEISDKPRKPKKTSTADKDLKDLKDLKANDAAANQFITDFGKPYSRLIAPKQQQQQPPHRKRQPLATDEKLPPLASSERISTLPPRRTPAASAADVNGRKTSSRHKTKPVFVESTESSRRREIHENRETGRTPLKLRDPQSNVLEENDIFNLFTGETITYGELQKRMGSKKNKRKRDIDADDAGWRLKDKPRKRVLTKRSSTDAVTPFEGSVRERAGQFEKVGLSNSGRRRTHKRRLTGLDEAEAEAKAEAENEAEAGPSISRMDIDIDPDKPPTQDRKRPDTLIKTLPSKTKADLQGILHTVSDINFDREHGLNVNARQAKWDTAFSKWYDANGHRYVKSRAEIKAHLKKGRGLGLTTEKIKLNNKITKKKIKKKTNKSLRELAIEAVAGSILSPDEIDEIANDLDWSQAISMVKAAAAKSGSGGRVKSVKHSRKQY